ncbi:MAG TPA: FG-GAP-like repeat-containing protein, partial [Polyangiaceae bacterium]|nr:FG-GAP-like repeat-containing protein [Polyangiaceae bacterium]
MVSFGRMGLGVALFLLVALGGCGADDTPGSPAGPPAACDAASVRCGGRCTQIATDPANCGACGRACAAGQACLAGACVDPCPSGACAEVCAPPFEACGAGTCADLRNDPSNCGACGRACPEGDFCAAGACVPRAGCAAPLTSCDVGGAELCADLRSDPSNCGGCGNACPGGQLCAAGVCATACAPPLSTCFDGAAARCVDLRSDLAHCGQCGQACGAGQACLSGACVATCEGAGGTLCGGACVDLDSDDKNCGACGTPCAAGTSCQGGACEPSCPAPQILCGGACLDPRADPANCGACGKACPTGICREGECAAPACGGAVGLPNVPLPPYSSHYGEPRQIVLADLEGEGTLTLVRPLAEHDLVELRRTTGPETFGPEQIIPVGQAPSGVAAGDVDGDGLVDLVVANRDSHTVSVLRNEGGGAFARTDLAAGGPGTRCALGDLDGDGMPDLVVTYFAEDRFAVALNVGGGAFGPFAFRPSAKPRPEGPAIADLDGDGVADVLVLSRTQSTAPGAPDVDVASVSTYAGLGGGALAAPKTYAVGQYPVGLEVVDLDGDGRRDVAVAADLGEDISVLRNDGQGGLSPRASVPAGGRVTSFAAADFDHDGDVDFAINRSFELVAILRNDGGGAFGPPDPYLIRTWAVAAADADGDGATDLIMASGAPQVFLQKGGTFLAPRAYPLAVAGGGEAEAMAVTDVDGDGHLDAVAPVG